jgi:hypothetical protein
MTSKWRKAEGSNLMREHHGLSRTGLAQPELLSTRTVARQSKRQVRPLHQTGYRQPQDSNPVFRAYRPNVLDTYPPTGIGEEVP